jgi:tellurite resistance protein TerA
VAIDYTKRPKTAPAPPTPTTRVTLTKAAPSVSLTKRGGSRGTLRVNLQWNARPEPAPADAPPARGLFKRLQAGSSTGNIDLDLACMYEYADGSKGVVQALGGALRDQSAGTPLCWLDGDDRSGAAADGENLYVDLGRVAEIKRILVFAFIYEGVPNWAAADAVVTLHPASGPEIEVRLDEHDPNASMCAIAMLENDGGELGVARQMRYVRGHRDLDEAYGWGMRWSAGRK